MNAIRKLEVLRKITNQGKFDCNQLIDELEKEFQDLIDNRKKERKAKFYNFFKKILHR